MRRRRRDAIEGVALRWLKTEGLGEDFVPDVLAERFRSADVDLDAEDFFELGAKSQEREWAGIGLEVDEEIDVAVRPLVASGH